MVATACLLVVPWGTLESCEYRYRWIMDVDVDVEEKMKNTVGCFRETRSFAGINLGRVIR